MGCETDRTYCMCINPSKGGRRGTSPAVYHRWNAFYCGTFDLAGTQRNSLVCRTYASYVRHGAGRSRGLGDVYKRQVQDLLHTDKDDDFNKLFSRVEKYENISDNMELEIANYLNQVSEGRLSSESKLQIRAMLREVTEIESIGDSCYNLARTINRKRQTNQDFTEKQYEHIHFMMKLTDDALAQMIVVVEKPEHQSIDINKSFNIENEINNYRNQLKNQNILDVNNKEYDYQMGVYYMDIIAECEKLGDYVVNVVEASSDVKEKKAS